MTLPYEVVCSSTDRDAWKAARRTGITASNVSRVMRMNKYDAKKRTYEQVIDDLARGVDEPDNLSMWVGSVMERHILDRVATNVYECDPGELKTWGELLRSKESPWLMATPDARWNDYLIEVKWVGVYSQADWSSYPPDYVQAQVQCQLYVTGLKLAKVPMCCTKNEEIISYNVWRNDAFIECMLVETKQAWEQICEIREGIRLNPRS